MVKQGELQEASFIQGHPKGLSSEPCEIWNEWGTCNLL